MPTFVTNNSSDELYFFSTSATISAGDLRKALGTPPMPLCHKSRNSSLGMPPSCCKAHVGEGSLCELKQAAHSFERISCIPDRLTGQEKQIFFHHRSAICLYPGEMFQQILPGLIGKLCVNFLLHWAPGGPAAHGWLVGFAVVHMSFDSI